jgi:hypothetical protein
LFSKIIISKLRIYKFVRQNIFPKAILQNDSRKLRPKIATKSCSPKLPSKTIIPKLRTYIPKRLSKAIQQGGSRKLLLKIAIKSSPKLLVKSTPKVIPQSCCFSNQFSGNLSKLFPKAVPRSYFPKLFPKIPLQSGCPKVVMLQT